MTPKEKAIELKHKMYAKILDYNLDYTDSNNIEELNTNLIIVSILILMN